MVDPLRGSTCVEIAQHPIGSRCRKQAHPSGHRLCRSRKEGGEVTASLISKRLVFSRYDTTSHGRGERLMELKEWLMKPGDANVV